jgi:hypothetical protein
MPVPKRLDHALECKLSRYVNPRQPRRGRLVKLIGASLFSIFIRISSQTQAPGPREGAESEAWASPKGRDRSGFPVFSRWIRDLRPETGSIDCPRRPIRCSTPGTVRLRISLGCCLFPPRPVRSSVRPPPPIPTLTRVSAKDARAAAKITGSGGLRSVVCAMEAETAAVRHRAESFAALRAE